ncbi:MAG: hypothetical protein DCF21_00810 [Leptolyngbya sp.]|nr:MAG: hypothetical protein DCF21_00810 [Leptolyngbya sp.]
MSKSEPLIFFTDECLGRLVPTALKEAGMTVELYLDWFRPGVIDVEWIPQVGQRGWLILTVDEMIGRRIPEQIAIAYAGAKAFVMASNKRNSQSIAAAFIQAASAMEQLAHNSEAPFIAKVYANGDVKLWRDCDSLWDIIEKYSK